MPVKMQQEGSNISRAWFAICWFTIWGFFKGFAVFSVLNGTWERPEAFPARAYEALVYPDIVFIPFYFLTAVLLISRHWFGNVLAFVTGGGIVYVMIYLLALSGFSGASNLVADGVFLACTLVSLWQVGCRTVPEHAV
jgi:hypothetical protein